MSEVSFEDIVFFPFLRIYASLLFFWFQTEGSKGSIYLMYIYLFCSAAIHRYSFPSDVWSIGVIALECWLGSHPYEVTGMQYLDLLTKILHSPPPGIVASDGSQVVEYRGLQASTSDLSQQKKRAE